MEWHHTLLFALVVLNLLRFECFCEVIKHLYAWNVHISVGGFVERGEKYFVILSFYENLNLNLDPLMLLQWTDAVCHVRAAAPVKHKERYMQLKPVPQSLISNSIDGSWSPHFCVHSHLLSQGTWLPLLPWIPFSAIITTISWQLRLYSSYLDSKQAATHSAPGHGAFTGFHKAQV